MLIKFLHVQVETKKVVSGVETMPVGRMTPPAVLLQKLIQEINIVWL